MFTCGFCEKQSTESWTGRWCETCRKLKNLGNVYGFEELYDICERVCIRDEKQRQNKIDLEKKIDYVKKDGKWVNKPCLN